MSDQKDGTQEANQETAEQVRLSKIPTDRDWFLSHFVTMADKYGEETGVTLNVGGTIISGNIVSGADYFKGFAEEYASSFRKPEDAETIIASYTEYSQIHPRVKYDENGEELEEKRNENPIYIHLKDAKFFSNGQPAMPGNRGLWWRGRLAAVDGFSLGRLSHD